MCCDKNDKNINININIDSLVEELRFNKEEIMMLKENNFKMRLMIDKAIEYIKQNKELSVDSYYRFKDLCEFDDLLNILGGVWK